MLSKQTLYEELADYTNRDLQLVTERCKIAPIELAWQFEANKDDLIKYYKESEFYIFDLTLYQTMLKEQGFHAWLAEFFYALKIKTALDFGGGIGEYAITACKKNIKTSYLEIAESKTLEYAKYRFKKHQVNPEILDLESTIENYDVIICMDVLEHIRDNEIITEKLAKHCKYFICNQQEEIPYNWIYPQHVSKLNLEPYFDNIAGRLWKSKLYKQ